MLVVVQVVLNFFFFSLSGDKSRLDGERELRFTFSVSFFSNGKPAPTFSLGSLSPGNKWKWDLFLEKEKERERKEERKIGTKEEGYPGSMDVCT